MVDTLVIYDSVYGNTKQIADSIASELAGSRLMNVLEIEPKMLNEFNLIIFGCPTHGGNATKDMGRLIKSLEPDSLKGKKVAAFDTWIIQEDKNFFKKTFINLLGHASAKFSKELVIKGGELVAEPVGFLVKEKEGPLVDGEINRAQEWAKKICL
jgi:flavodoxin